MNKLIEKLAALAHMQWSSWMKYLFEKSIAHPDGCVTIPKELVARWSRQLNTEYAELPEEEKTSDRHEAHRILDQIFTLAQLQEELKPWQEHNFGSHPGWQPLMGAVEEIGELAHAHLKQTQGIRGTTEEHQAAKKDAVCDCIVFLADYCNQEGIDLNDALSETWAQVRKRDFKRFPKDGLS